MAGNEANPVILDPAQIITEVGWPGTPYIALSFLLGRRTTFQLSNTCSPGTGFGGVPFYLDTGEFDLPPAHVSDGYESAYVLDGTGWGTISVNDIVVSGLPTFPVSAGAGSWGYLEYVAGDDLDVVDAGYPFCHWIEMAGAEHNITVPFSVKKFMTGANAVIELAGFVFTGSTYCDSINTSPSYELRDYLPDPLALSGAEPLQVADSQYTFDFSGISAVYDGDTYEAIAARAINIPVYWEEHQANRYGGRLYVLLEKVTA